MYELAVQSSFSATHSLFIRGVREESHHHQWQIVVEVAGAELDADGLLMDFHELERLVAKIIEPFDRADLNQTPPFDEENPTAEAVASHIGRTLMRVMKPHQNVQLKAVRVTEAPRCVATYRPD